MENEYTLPPFLEFLKRNREDAGVMADLRSALIPSREFRVWQYIVRYCNLEDERERIIASTVAAAFGIQPECGSGTENIGDVMRRIACGESGKEGLSSYALRFQRLLACDTVEEISQQLHGIFKAAKSRGIPINHAVLWQDLHYWGERVKRRWAVHYWGTAGKETQEGDEVNE